MCLGKGKVWTTRENKLRWYPQPILGRDPIAFCCWGTSEKQWIYFIFIQTISLQLDPCHFTGHFPPYIDMYEISGLSRRLMPCAWRQEWCKSKCIEKHGKKSFKKIWCLKTTAKVVFFEGHFQRWPALHLCASAPEFSSLRCPKCRWVCLASVGELLSRSRYRWKCQVGWKKHDRSLWVYKILRYVQPCR